MVSTAHRMIAFQRYFILEFCIVTVTGVPNVDDDMLEPTGYGVVSLLGGNDQYQGLQNGEKISLPQNRDVGNTYAYRATTSVRDSRGDGAFDSIDLDIALSGCSGGSVDLDFTEGESSSSRRTALPRNSHSRFSSVVFLLLL